MQINPGGRLAIDDVVGRDHKIDRYWHVLERQGLILSAERRIGKTHILLKMCEECQPGYLPFYQDLESVHSVADLIRSIYTAVDHSLRTVPGLKGRIAKWSAYSQSGSPAWTCQRLKRHGPFCSPAPSTISSASRMANGF